MMKEKVADLRSDTVTRPTPGMLEAMMQANVGDDVYGEDETVNALQRKAAKLFGMEAAIFCPSGTMTNQIAVKLHTQPADEVLCHELAHIYLYEGGGIAFHSGASVRLLRGGHGRFTAEQLRSNINSPDDPHLPQTRLVEIENTVNKGGGACWDLMEIGHIRALCDARELVLHLDGARLFNALVARREPPERYGALFHTISICLSKGLGAPAGSLLLGTRAMIGKAHRLRKLMGGGMRQAGYLAAAGIYALNHHVERLREDHERAKALEAELLAFPYIAEVFPVETNIVLARLQKDVSIDALIGHLKERNVLAIGMGEQLVRFVFHLDVGDLDMEMLRNALRRPGL